jgi:hypothetical protein
MWELEVSSSDPDARGTVPLELVYADAWSELQWWESPLQARRGIESLMRVPYLVLQDVNDHTRAATIPTRKLYSVGLHSVEAARIEQAQRYVVAAIRQAREYYSAATTIGVSVLTKPVLYFYGALTLSRAAVVAAFGVEGLDPVRHGLSVRSGPSIRSLDQGAQPADWPTLIKWEGRGEFAAFYRAARWDIIYQVSPGKSPGTGWPAFHILECLRFLKCEWGTLPQAVDWPQGWAGTRPKVQLLMPYSMGRHLYLRDLSELLQFPVVQVPRIVVQYMVLKYFADLARYHPVEWQALLDGAMDLEGYVFRAAIDRVAREYVCEMMTLLPRPSTNRVPILREWTKGPFRLEDWYAPPSLVVGGPTLALELYELDEWAGDDGPDQARTAASPKAD